MSKPAKQPEDNVTNLPISIEEEMRRELEALRDRVGALPSNIIKTDNKKFTLPTGDSNAELTVIVLDHLWSLVHYKGKWNPNQPQSPDCWAIGREKPESGLLMPHADVPKAYGDNCAVCPKNQWGSGDGNAKACRNQRRLLVVGAQPDEKTVPLMIYVKPASLKNWDSYLMELGSVHKINPIQAITKISFDPNESYNKLVFSFVERNPYLELAVQLRLRGQEQLTRSIEVRKEAA